ncbi:MAG: AAA family ATPase [Bacteroidales bacterium]|nr:AAA family ATPase [Bacteroidales bacterium]
MKRKIYQKLLEWKRHNGTSALLIKGARRVGKSYIAEQLGRNEYKSYIKVDFNDISKDDLSLILDNLHDRDRLFSYLQLLYNTPLHERESLIIFDEIQECPKVRAAIKYLVADGRYDYVETGSLMSIRKNTEGIVIPSEEEHLDMYPMDFEEYLWACGEEPLAQFITQCYEKLEPLPQAFHRKAIQLFKEYMVIGGMPQVVKKYLETKDFNEADREKDIILTLYRGDIAKHAGTYTFKVESIFDAIPSQLAKHEKKFKLAAIAENARMRNYIEPFTWLDDAKFVNLCYGSTEPSLGLAMNADRTSIKCYLGDTGLLYGLAFDNAQEKNDTYRKIILGKLSLNEGMFTENVVAQLIASRGHRLFFYSNTDREDSSNSMELDFLLPKSKVTNKHNINIIEVKSGDKYRLSSLQKARAKYVNEINQSFVLHPDNLKRDDGILFIPLYMAGLL